MNIQLYRFWAIASCHIGPANLNSKLSRGGRADTVSKSSRARLTGSENPPGWSRPGDFKHWFKAV